jgi:hypothetical protein
VLLRHPAQGWEVHRPREWKVHVPVTSS